MQELVRKNFKPEEFFYSDTAKRLGIRNYPAKEQEAEIKANLISTADMMQEVRDLLGAPITINSAYRCKKLNRAVGSSDRSQHLLGLACDFTAKGRGSPKDVMMFLKEKGFVVDQCLCEGSWLHISRLREGRNRNQYAYYLFDNKLNKRVFTLVG